MEMSTGKFSANEPFVESNVLYFLDVCKNGCNLSGELLSPNATFIDSCIGWEWSIYVHVE